MSFLLKTSTDYKLANLFFLCCLFPFISIFPIGSDVQPTCALVAAIFYTLKILKSRKISKSSVFLILSIIFAFLYVNPLEVVAIELGKLFALVCALLTFTFIKQYNEYFSPKLFSIAIGVYFTLSILFLIFPSQLVAFQSLLVRKMNVTEFGYRGISTLSTEPGLFGGLLVGFLALNVYFLYSKRIKKFTFFINLIQLLVMLWLTKSGTGVAYLLIFVFAFFVLRRFDIRTVFKVSLISFFFGGLLLSVSVKNLDVEKLGRGVDTFVKLTTEPELLIADRSIVYRLYAVYVSYLSVLDNPIGVGHGNVEFESQRIVEQQPALNHFYGSYGEKFHPVSSFGFYLTAYGMFFLIPVIYLLISSSAAPSFKILSLVYILFSYSFAFPMTWLLLNLSLKRK
ncbi:hypothetical protein [Shewanella algae]|uniref:hypothetical protein n=1 Tax=Shewanella algae TaxID=38313 RepID=UPI0034D3ECD8